MYTLSTCDVSGQKIMESSLHLHAICFILQNILFFLVLVRQKKKKKCY